VSAERHEPEPRSFFFRANNPFFFFLKISRRRPTKQEGEGLPVVWRTMAGRRAAIAADDGDDGDGRQHSGSVLYMTSDLLARHGAAAGGVGRLETLRIDGLRRSDRIRTLENLSAVPALLHLELPCHNITSMAPVLVCSVSAAFPPSRRRARACPCAGAACRRARSG